MGVGHYENFPVGSLLLPKPLRIPVHAIYRFARTADDLADEGTDPPEIRLDKLAALTQELDRIATGQQPDTLLMQELLAQAITPYSLSLQPFYDLLSAFSQDVVKTRYETFEEVLDYCRRSADPVGRLMLALYGANQPENITLSDHICTALQLINFWQDVAIDWPKNRVYLPQEDLKRFQITEQDIADSRYSSSWQALMQFEIDRTREKMLAGAPLGRKLKGRIGLELRTIIQGGAQILTKLERCQGDIFQHRPVLGTTDWLLILKRAI